MSSRTYNKIPHKLAILVHPDHRAKGMFGPRTHQHPWHAQKSLPCHHPPSFQAWRGALQRPRAVAGAFSSTMIDQAQRERMRRNRELALRRLTNRKAVTGIKEHAVTGSCLQPGIQPLGGTEEVKSECILLDKSSNLHASQKEDACKGQELGAVTPSVTQEFDYLVVIDFEATCDKNMEDLSPQEIIEFPSVLVNCRHLKLEDSFQTYVKPIHHPVLTDFCMRLTGIQQAQVDSGVPLVEALAGHDRWLEKKGVKDKKFAVLTWSDWDCKVMLESECKFKGLKKPPYFNRWINLKVPFQNSFKGLKCNLRKAVEAAGLKWQGRPHCGLDDARNTARLALELMRRGIILTVTNSFTIYAADGSLIFVAKIRRPRMPSTDVQVCLVDKETQYSSETDGVVKDKEEDCMLCFCGVRSKKRMVKKPGPTHGKFFFACGKWTITDGGGCLFFEWAASPSGLPLSNESKSSYLT